MSYEPTDEDNDFLNKIDGGYIGYTKPQVEHVVAPPYIPDSVLEILEGDHLRIDEQEFDPERR